MSNMVEIDYLALGSLPELLKLLREKGVSQDEYQVHVSRYHEQKARQKGVPLQGMFELTPLCNLDCKMCYVHLNRDQMGETELLSVEQWESIMRQAHEMGMMHATLTGGECLTYPGFDELYLFLRSLGIKPGIKTNGLLLDRKRLDFFKEYHPSGIDISLYGSSNEAYERVTGYAAFDWVYENLLGLKKADFPVRLAITPSIYMYEDVTRIVELAKELSFPVSVNIGLFPPRAETGRTLCDLSIDQYLSIYKRLYEGNAEPREPAEAFDLPDYKSTFKQRVGLPCGAGRSFFNVNWRGEIKGCENLNSLQVSALDYPFKVAWEQVHADAVAFPLPEECGDCAYDPVCFSCIAYRSNGAERGHCNPKVCERTKRMIREGFYHL